ncbi:hypothetical protein BTZ20_1460 [Rhodococcus sp. MTM3W5.2]|nr:hypothetical protein [Rhodococcus sp. MTM3W5.2]AQA25181.1 hypothetical protein BTZ20_1460 [Rhodococcus sp. MTM3W5.2]
MTITQEKAVPSTTVLECHGLSAGYGGTVVCRGLDITVRSGRSWR